MEQSHQVHRRQLHAGRQQLAQGNLQQAIDTWKHALESAYGANDFATMFVLARNLGQTCQRQAAAGDREARTATLERARDYFQYALAVAEQCSLDNDVLQRHRVLAKVMRSLERRREQVEDDIKSLRRQLQEQKHQQSPEQQTVHEEIAVPTVEVCTTCGAQASLGNTIVVDEADGCPYCEACFIQFYESEQAQPSGAADEDVLSSSSSSQSDPEEILDDFDSDEEEPEPTPSELSLMSEEIQFDAQLMMERIDEVDEEKEALASMASSSIGSLLNDDSSVVTAAEDTQPHTLDVEEAVSSQLPPASVSLTRMSYPISVLLSLQPAACQFECPREIQTSAVYWRHTDSSVKSRKKPKKDIR